MLSQRYNSYQVPILIPFITFLLILFITCQQLQEVNQMNVIYRYTYQEPYYSPGTLTSGRDSAVWWGELLAGRARFVFIVLTILRMVYFNSTWTYNFHWISALLFMCLELLNIILLGIELDKCNEVVNNMCNDYRWCGVAGNVGSGCPASYCQVYNLAECIDGNITACTITNSTGTLTQWSPSVTKYDLSWNTEFTISFAASLAMLILGIFIAALSCAINPRAKKTDYTTEEDDDTAADDRYSSNNSANGQNTRDLSAYPPK